MCWYAAYISAVIDSMSAPVLNALFIKVFIGFGAGCRIEIAVSIAVTTTLIAAPSHCSLVGHALCIDLVDWFLLISPSSCCFGGKAF